MKIAIIDGKNQDIGLKLLFPEADYFIDYVEYDIKNQIMDDYKIYPIYDWSNINDINYDYLFVIIAVYDINPETPFYKQNVYNMYLKINNIINRNNFKKVLIFDNYDYDYDPNDIWKNDKITFFFKRNYSKKKIYNKNVIPFPFIMFGEISIISKIDNFNYQPNKIPRIFFTGSLFNHEDPIYNHYRSRINMYIKIQQYIFNPGRIPYDIFLNEMLNSKYSLDLNGVGDPNKRLFEILSQGSLMISEYNDLVWPFEETFSQETIFRTSEEFFEKINLLEQNDELYIKCLSNQINIFIKYFNRKWIKEYILQYL
jgi:hypothetical protein